jgi:DNA-binding response OmpR family regulator
VRPIRDLYFPATRAASNLYAAAPIIGSCVRHRSRLRSFSEASRLCSTPSSPLKLSPREYDLLRLLVAHAGKVLTHRFILHEVWGGESDVQYLRIYIRALRHKIEADPERPQHILTEQGVGYRLRAPD